MRTRGPVRNGPCSRNDREMQNTLERKNIVVSFLAVIFDRVRDLRYSFFTRRITELYICY